MKQEYFYFECDTVSGKLMLAVEANSKTLGDLIDAEKDLQKIILEPCEKVLRHIPCKPPRRTWEIYKKGWCLVGTKKIKAIFDAPLARS